MPLQASEATIIIYLGLKTMLLLHRGSFNDHSISVWQKGGFHEVACPTTDVQLFEPKVSISDKLTIQLACELLRSHGVSLTTVEFPVRAFFIQTFSVDHAADTGNSAV
jgi:hypothetical protein